MDVLDRFLVREFFKFFLLVTFGMALLFLGVDFLANLWRSELTVARMFHVYVLRLPEAIQQFVPMGCLLGALLVLSTMSRQNEILALYTSGIGVLRIVSTFVAVVATVSTFSFLIFDSLVPTFTKKQIMIRRGISQLDNLGWNSSNTGVWYRTRNLIYYVGRFVPETTTLENVSIYVVNGSFQSPRSSTPKKPLTKTTTGFCTKDTLLITVPEAVFPP